MSETIESLLSYAGHRFYDAGIPYKGYRMSKIVRRAIHEENPRGVIDAYLDDQVSGKTWHGFELYAHGGYKDPTGATAAQNVDLERQGR